MSVIPKSPFPNVPKLPGVPQLRRSPNFPSSLPPALGVALGVAKLFGFGAGRGWGVFNDRNEAVLNPDSIVDFSVGNDYNIGTFPVQQGQFASYNKVNLPTEYVVRMSKGGDDADRLNFIASVQAVAASLSLYTIITPESVFKNVNVTRYEITRRGAQGAYFLAEVDMYFREIKQVVPSYIGDAQLTQDAQEPGALPPQSQGQVQSAVLPSGATFDPATALA